MSEQKRPYRDYFDSEYLTGDALDAKGTTFIIADKSRAVVENLKGDAEHKLVLVMTSGAKWLSNITNCRYMTEMFGSPYPVDWIGKRVTLAFDPTVKFGKETVGGIRVIGSPDISAPLSFMFAANSRQKPRKVTLMPTGDGADAGEDFAFTDDAPHAAQDGADGDANGDESDDGLVPGRGPETAQAEMTL
jgi:hypothetical protein